MRIEHLLELINTDVSQHRYNGVFRSGNEEDPSALGSGNFSTVKSDKKDPHMVRKHHHTPTGPGFEDEYVTFINFIIENKIHSPFFPRVYNVKQIADKRKDKVYKYTLERLNSYNDVSYQELVVLIKRLVDMHIKPTMNKREIIIELGLLLEDAVKNGNMSAIKDDHLIEAINIFRTYYKMHAPFLDMSNSGNLMFRRTVHGIQLVIADPVA